MRIRVEGVGGAPPGPHSAELGGPAPRASEDREGGPPEAPPSESIRPEARLAAARRSGPPRSEVSSETED